jgi:F-type H+-transporting ATPase subunit delta
MASEVSKRYAKALFEIVSPMGAAEKTLQELIALNEAIQKNPETAQFISSPVVPPENKKAALKAATAGASDALKGFVKLLSEKKRLGLISDIVTSFRDIDDRAAGKTRGSVKSASSLSDDEKKQIEIKIKKATNKEVILSYEEDKSLLGGLVAQVGGWTFNDTLESHLTRISEDLHRRTN